MGKWERQKSDEIWVIPKAEVVQETTGTQLEMTYNGRRQGTVVQWVVLRPIFEVCARET